jgi:hypothetical protein
MFTPEAIGPRNKPPEELLCDLVDGHVDGLRATTSPIERGRMNEDQIGLPSANRPLSDEERQLVRWMLEHGSREASQFLPQLELAEATPWRCPCGCASFNFAIDGRNAPPGVHIIADFVFGGEDDLCGIFVFEKDGILSGLEFYGLAVDPPSSLPPPESLRPFRSSMAGA